MFSIKKHPLIYGTVALTGAGLLCRLIGFFFRIYLSRTFGGEQIGIYQLTGPVIGITLSITSGIFQTVISKLSAEEKNDNTRILFVGLTIALPLSFLFTIVLHQNAQFLATFWLKEPACAPLIRVFSLCIIPACFHNCLGGFFLGRKKIHLPAISQIAEQVVRTGSVILIVQFFIHQGRTPDLTIVMIGSLLGELCSMLFSAIAISLIKNPVHCKQTTILYKPFLILLLPLFSTRIVVNLLQAFETIMLPHYLKMHTTTPGEALNVYGTLTGMALPLILFPTTLTGSLATILLPSISGLRAAGQMTKARKTFSVTVRFCFVLGCFCGLFFFIFADFLGEKLFESTLCSLFIKTLAPLCPFLYMNTTLNGTLQGLGKMNTIFIIQVLCLSLRCLLLVLLLPSFGMLGYLYLLLFIDMLQCLLYFRAVRQSI